MNKLIGLIAVALISGCSNDTEANKPLQMPALKGKPETVQLVKDNWNKLLAHCPGLNKYQTDLTFDGIDDMLNPYMGEMSRAEVRFKISDNPKLIPNSFRAWGHTCGYGISPHGKSLRIQKSVCVSVCLEREYNGPTDYVAGL